MYPYPVFYPGFRSKETGRCWVLWPLVPGGGRLDVIGGHHAGHGYDRRVHVRGDQESREDIPVSRLGSCRQDAAVLVKDELAGVLAHEVLHFLTDGIRELGCGDIRTGEESTLGDVGRDL